MSSGPISGSSYASARPRPRASVSRVAPSSLNGGTIFLSLRTTKFVTQRFSGGRQSPTEDSTTVSIEVAGKAFARVAAKFSSTTIARAPLSASWCSSSRTVYSGLTLTTTSPALSTPSMTIGDCNRFGIMTATRSPRSSPASPVSHAARAFDLESNSAKLCSVPWFENAVRLPFVRQLSRQSDARDR